MFNRPLNLKLVKQFGLLTSAVALLGTATALAAPTSGQDSSKEAPHHRGGMGARIFDRLDKDHDGRVAIAELPARMKQHLNTIDANKDGFLTRAEFEQGKAQLKALREKELDKNGDGKVTDEERREAMRAHVVE